MPGTPQAGPEPEPQPLRIGRWVTAGTPRSADSPPRTLIPSQPSTADRDPLSASITPAEPACDTRPLPAIQTAPPGTRTKPGKPDSADAATSAKSHGGPLTGVLAFLVVASVVPLALLQLPNLLVSGMSAAMIARIAGPDGAPSLIRAAGLALPVMACAAPVAAVVARRHRAWPSLLAGLLLLGGADLLGGAHLPGGAGLSGLLGQPAHSVLLIAVDRALHGLGAGVALPATLALAWERTPRWRRVLCRWWTVMLVISMLGVVPLLRDRLASAGWQAALHPFGWLTAAALGITAGYAALARGAGPPPRAAVTPAERSQLGLLAVPLAGLGVLAVGISEQAASSVLTAAGVTVFVLACLALVTSADAVTGGDGTARARLGFPLVGACAGFVLAPTAGAIGTLRAAAAGPHPSVRALGLPLAAAAGACVLGALLAWLPRAGVTAAAGARPARHKAAAPRRSTRARLCVQAGLACAAAGLLVARITGPNGGAAGLAGAYALLAGGLALALAAAIAEATPAGAVSGLSLALAGALAGYLTAGAIQIRLVDAAGAPTAPRALAQALTSAASTWEVAAAGAAVLAAIGVLFIGRARRGKGDVPARG